MGYTFCSECGGGFHYYAGRGTHLEDAVSPCCRAQAAKGKMLEVSCNDLKNEWHTLKMKVFNIAGDLQFSSYPGKIVPVRDEGDTILFVPAKHEIVRPVHVPLDWQGYYRITKRELEKIGYGQLTIPTNCPTEKPR